LGETFGMRLIAERKAVIDPATGRPMSQTSVAVAVGVDPSTVRNWERDRSLPFGNNRKELLRLFPLLFSRRQS